MTTLTFEPEQHVYQVDGATVPSVTQVLSGFSQLIDYSSVPAFQLEFAAGRGTAAHKATELYDLGDLDEEGTREDDEQRTDHIRLMPYVDAWKQFRADTGFEPSIIEQRMYHSLYGYAGTVDRIGVLYGELAVVEIKTTAKLWPATAIQVAAYQEAFNHGKTAKERAKRRYAVQLRPDGTYRLEQYEDPADWSCFLALLTLQNWNRRYPS
jgi:hypothetical protein